jgi:hypothetical protein
MREQRRGAATSEARTVEGTPGTVQRSKASVAGSGGYAVQMAALAPRFGAPTPSPGIGLGAAVQMGGGGRPGNNQDQNRQFRGAVQEINRRIGRRITQDEERRLHEELHHEANPGYQEIVNIGLQLFGGGG